MPEILTGLGIFGLVTVCALASLFCLFQPIWALVDCVDSDRDRETKVLVTVAILFTWGLGSLVYGIFFAKSFSSFALYLVSRAAWSCAATCAADPTRRPKISRVFIV